MTFEIRKHEERKNANTKGNYSARCLDVKKKVYV
jgi:hypothetical protein